MEAAEREEFEEMLKVNGYGKEKIKEVLKTEREDAVDLLYSASAGSISIALMMLDEKIPLEELEEIPELSEEEYYSTEEIRKEENWAKKEGMIRSNMARMKAGIRVIYKKIKREDFALLALFAQDMAEEELEQFCKDSKIKDFCESKGYPLFWNLEDFNWMLESYEESFPERKRKVYTLNERWRKMRDFVKALKKDEVIEEEMRIIREVLLKIMTAEVETYGRVLIRMLLYALENIEWLKERRVFKLKEALFWGKIALLTIPFIKGLPFIEVVWDLWEKEEHYYDEILLYAAAYAYRLVEFGGLMFSSSEEYYKLIKLAENFMKEEIRDDAVLCYRAMAYSSSAHELARKRLKEYAKEYLDKAKEIIESMSELKELAEFYFYVNMAEVKRYAGENPFEDLKKSEEYLKKLEETGITEAMKRFSKPDGKAEEIFKRLFNLMHELVYINLGRAYMDTGEMKKARECFEKALDYSKTTGEHELAVEHELTIKSFLGRIEVLESYKFKWKAGEEKISFKDLWSKCKSNLWKLPTETIAGACGEYIVSEIVKGEFKREDLEYTKLHPDVFSLVNGIGCIFGFVGESDALEELKKLDLRGFPIGIGNSGEPAMLMKMIIETIKENVEELYNSALDPRRREKYEKIKIKKIKEEPIWHIFSNSWQVLARIMLFYIANDLEYAQKIAEDASEVYTKLQIMINRPFKELAEAIKREREGDRDAKEEVKRAFVKLFYCHV